MGSTLLTGSLAAWAETIALPTPQSGLWAIQSETPSAWGKSIALDAQDGLLVMQLATAADHPQGASVWIASGALQADASGENSTLTTDLLAESAVNETTQASTTAAMTVTFESSYRGLLQLGKDKPVVITRMALDSRHAAESEVQTRDAFTGHLYDVRDSTHLLSDSAFRLALLRPNNNQSAQLTLTIGDTPMPNPLSCMVDAASGAPPELSWICSGRTPEGAAATVQIALAGQEVVGQLKISSQSAASPTRTATAQLRGFRRFYEAMTVWNGEQTYYAHSETDPRYLVPQSGLWLFEDEKNEAQARTLALDVEGNTLALQVFGSSASDLSQLQLGSSRFTPNNVTEVTLSHYSAHATTALDRVGTALVSFDSLTTGAIALPGETARKIIRMPISGPPRLQSLRGVWRFNTLADNAITVNLNQLHDDRIESADGLFQCRYSTNDAGVLDGNVVCTDAKTNHADDSDNNSTRYFFHWEPGLSDLLGQVQTATDSKRRDTGISRLAYPSALNNGDYFSVGSRMTLELPEAP